MACGLGHRVVIVPCMRSRFSISVLLALSLCTGVAWAEDEIVIDVLANTENGQTTTSVSYGYAGCEDECHIATLTCTGNSIIVVVADVAATDAAKAIVKETRQIMFLANGKTFDYFIEDMQFAELTVSWWLTAHEQGSKPAEIPQAIANSKNIEVQVGSKTVLLPVDGKVKAWAEACK
jgi:hypothetical protein